jgi:heme A synthase
MSVRLARYAWGVVAYNVAVILWGAYVRATGSGAGCGAHWPLCDGAIIPREPSVAMLIEYSHRLTSGLAALQLGLGFVNVILLAPVWMQLVHLLVADLVWMALVRLSALALAAPVDHGATQPAASLSPLA